MIETYSEGWEKFEHSGRVTDYLQYRGINSKSFSAIKGERVNDNDKGHSDLLQRDQ